MNNVATITWLTFHEAWRRKMVLAGLILGLAFIILFGIGFKLILDNVARASAGMGGGIESTLWQSNFDILFVAALYVVHFLGIMLAIFASVDTVSGEIASHTIQAVVTKPIRRWQVIAGKWLGYAGMIVVYVTLLSLGVLGVVYAITGQIPPNAGPGIALLGLESLVLLSLSLLGGTYFSTLTNGVVLFMVYGVAFIGSWVEQIGSLLQSTPAQQLGIAISLLMPVEALWRRAAYEMQPPLLRDFSVGPFNMGAVPSDAMIYYAGIYTVVILLLAMRKFSQRDL